MRTREQFIRMMWLSGSRGQRRRGGFTLTEVVMSIALAAIMIGSLVTGYIQAVNTAEWSAYSLAAQSLAMQGVEQVRAAKWDPNGNPPVDQVVLSNFQPRIEVLDIPISGTNIVYATNRTFIATVSTRPALKMVRVETTWSYPRRGTFTNTMATYRAPDQ